MFRRSLRFFIGTPTARQPQSGARNNAESRKNEDSAETSKNIVFFYFLNQFTCKFRTKSTTISISMETKDIQKLIDFISLSNLDEVSIETSELKLSIKRYGAAPVIVQQAAPAMIAAPVAAAPVAVAAAPAAVAPAAPVAAPPAEPVSNLVTVKSPMIGTFYRSPSPDKPSLVEVGDEILVGKVVCVIEAMKLFNEIESEISGKIVKILVENASPVEYDQPLFLVEPA